MAAIACGSESRYPVPHIIVANVAHFIARAFKKKRETLEISHQPVTEESLDFNIESQRKCMRDLKHQFSHLFLCRDRIAMCLSGATNADLLTQLNDVAFKVENVIAEDYVRIFATSQDAIPASHPNLHMLSLITQRPTSDFEIDRFIRSDIADCLKQLLYAMQELSDLIEDAIPLISHMEHDQPNFAKSHLWTPFDNRRASPCVQPLAERLHRSLHHDWPCQREEHKEGHNGTLGECTHAYMRLDPQWIMKGVEGHAFSIVLSIDGQYQECNVHLSTSSGDVSSEMLCLLPYDEVRHFCLCLEVDAADRLLWDNNTDPMDLQMLEAIDSHSVPYRLFSIRDLLDCVKLSPWAKRYIQIILARSILPLLQGRWVERSLTTNDVSILCAMNADVPYPRFDNLFISTSFGDVSDTPKRRPYHHPVPVVQALGILIAAIELGEELEVICREQNLDGKVPKRDGEVLFNECSKRSLDTTGVLHSIRFCIDFRSFSDYRELLKVGMPQHDPEFAKHYYTNIIRPLEKDLVDGCRWSWEEATWRTPRPLEKAIVKVIGKDIHEKQRTRHDEAVFVGKKFNLDPIAEELSHMDIPAIYQPSVSCGTPVLSSDARIGVASAAEAPQTDAWFKKISDCHTMLHRDLKWPLKLKRLVKVAILDTGVDLNHPVFSEHLESGQMHAGLDLIDDGQRITDTDGHGTHVCHTLLMTAPHARVFPIRVFKGREADESSPLRVAEAIKHAICEWDVDIISMSLGFDREHEAIKTAMELQYTIRNGCRKRVLMFAAACNNRALEDQPIGYPARESSQVIGVFSSRIDGRRSDFSPKGRRYQPNISVIGEDVSAAWPPAHFQTMSGTSCATPIVAGIAALLLELSLKELDITADVLVDWKREKGKLRESSHMQIVLRECMSDEKRMDGVYNFLKPWKLFRQQDVFIVSDLIRALKLDV